MEKIIINIAIVCAILLLRILYSALIYFKCSFPNKKVQNLLTTASFIFPTIAGIICIAKYRRRAKDFVWIVASFTLLIVAAFLISNYNSVKFYDKNGNEFSSDKHITYTDRDNNSYSYDFEKSGYDYLFINNTDECLNTNYCYLDKDGYLVYDGDLSITAKDEYTCVDTDGSIYYPVKYTNYTQEGLMEYSFNTSNFNYDRLGKAYTYDYVPYYDKAGNKYVYSFNSDSQKGIYTKISTGDTFENEYSFIDKDGYFVYDKNHEFKRISEEQNKTYTDANGNVYYWASGVDWEKDGKLIVIQ